MLSLRQLEMVEALARHGHFARAAKDLRISQPALSQAIQSIEAEIGERLFDRGSAGAKPTLFGRIVLDHGKAVLRDMAALNREIELARMLDAGNFSVSASIFPAELWAPQALSRLSQDHTKLSCRLISGDGWRCVQDVEDGRSDVAITDIDEISDKAELIAHALQALPIVCFARPKHPLFKRKTFNLSRMLEYPSVGPQLPRSRSMAWFNDIGLGWAVEAMFTRSHDGHLMPRITVGTFAAMLHVVETSDAIGWAPLPIVEPYVAAGRIRKVSLGDVSVISHFGLIVRRNVQATPATRRFIKLAQAIRV